MKTSSVASNLHERIAEFRDTSALIDKLGDGTPEIEQAFARRYKLWEPVLYGKPASIEELAAQATLMWDEFCEGNSEILNHPEVANFLRTLPDVLRDLRRGGAAQ